MPLPARLDRHEFPTLPRRPIRVVLDGVARLPNIGTMFRLCDAFRVERLYVCGFALVLHKRKLVKGGVYVPCRIFRDDPVVQSIPGSIDGLASTAQLEHIAGLFPDEWLAPAAAGTPEQCADAIRNQLDIGCDGVIMHGATPQELAPIVTAYAR